MEETNQIISLALIGIIVLAGTGFLLWKADCFNKNCQDNTQFQIFERCLESEYDKGFNDGIYEAERGYCDGYSQGRFDVKNQPEINRCE